MNPNILLSIIFCFHTILCTHQNFSDLCKEGPADEVITALEASFADTEALHHQAQLCFDEAVDGNNLKVLEALPKVFLIDPNHIFQGTFQSETAEILLTSNWSIDGTEISGKELVTTRAHLLTVESPRDLWFVLVAGARLGYLDVVKSLVEVEHVDFKKEDNTALFMAAVSGHNDIVRYILGRSATDRDWLNDVYILACMRGNKDRDFLPVVKILCEEFKVDPKVFDGKAIAAAAGSGNFDLMEYLISKGLDLSKFINHSLYQACVNGQVEMAKFLLSLPGINPADHDNQILEASLSNQHSNIVEVLLQYPSVVAALKSSHINTILRIGSSGKTKLILLNWIAYNMKELGMGWILEYKKLRLTNPNPDPESVAKLKAAKDFALEILPILDLDYIGKFIEFWAEALEAYATWNLLALDQIRQQLARGERESPIGEIKITGQILDAFDNYLLVTLPEYFNLK